MTAAALAEAKTFEDDVQLAIDAVEFLKRAHPGGPWTLSAKTPQGFPTRTFTSEDSARNFIQQHNGQHDLYWAVNPLLRAMNKKAADADVKEVKYLHLDIDPPKDADDKWKERALLRLTRDRIKGVPEPTIVIDSGRGIQAFWALEQPIQVDGDVKLAKEVSLYTEQLALLFDGDHCQDISRVMRLPGTRNLKNGKLARKLQFKSELQYPLSAFKQASAPLPKNAAVVGVNVDVGAAPRRLADIDELAPWNVPERVRVVCVQGRHPEESKQGDNSRSAWVFDAVCQLVRHKVPDDVIYSILTDRDFGISESVLEQRGKAAQYALRQIARAKETAAADEAQFQTTEKGVVLPNQHNIRVALAKLGVRLSYNQFSDKSIIQGLPGYGPTLQDEAIRHLWLQTDRNHGFRPPRDFFWDVVQDTARNHCVHPVKEYLDGLEWDGTERVNSWLTAYGGAEAGNYTSAVGALVLIAAVRRVREPGCKFDEILVLKSEQGKGKSTAIATLVPDPTWFSDDLPIGADAQKVIETTQGKWIIEAAELKGIQRKGDDAVKAFLSRGVDMARMAYARLQKEARRQFIIIGTTNDEKFLRDTTGNRRWWPVEVQRFDLDALARDRDQLWAEAAHREAGGESIRLDPELYAVAAEHQEANRVEDPLVDTLETALGALQGKILAADVWELLSVPVAQRTQDLNARLGKAMKDLGWEHKQLRLDGQRQYHYVRGSAEYPSRIVVVRGPDGRGQADVEQPETGRIPF